MNEHYEQLTCAADFIVGKDVTSRAGTIVRASCVCTLLFTQGTFNTLIDVCVW